MNAPAILCVHPNRELYGSDRVFLQTLRALRAKWPNAAITAVLPGCGPLTEAVREITPDVQVDDLFVLRRSRLSNLLLELPLLFGRILAARRMMSRYDMTYISTSVAVDFILASRGTSANTVIHVHELPTGIARIVFSSLLWFSKASLVFISEQSQKSFLGISHKRQNVIWNGTQALKLPPVSAYVGRPLHVLLIGRFNAWKGQSLLIDAVALLTPEQRASVKVRLLGSVFEGQEHFRSKILADIDRHRLHESVEVLPFDPDPRAHYAWADIVAVPSTQPEPFGLVAIEAMSAGRAVLAADHGGLSEIVDHEVTGLKVTPRDAVAWSQALARYLRDRELATAHGKAGRQRFDECFDETAYTSRIAEAIDLTVTSHRAR
jgi:glycosyltransferase involved in cell wall biosynthesis